VFDFLQANLHESSEPVHQEDHEFHDANEDEVIEDGEANSSDLLVNAAKSSKSLQPGDIRRVMSKSSTRRNTKELQRTTREAHAHVSYRVSSHHSRPTQSLVDRGANGGVAGEDVRVIHKYHRTVDIQGIDNHQVNDIHIGTVGGVVQTHHGPVIAIMNQYALLGKGYTIHSPAQIEWYKNDVNDKSKHVGGLQRIKTHDGYLIPLAFKNGLPRMEIRPFTDK
jgi:hypothetical protein